MSGFVIGDGEVVVRMFCNGLFNDIFGYVVGGEFEVVGVELG